jgi:hypothetical protein
MSDKLKNMHLALATLAKRMNYETDVSFDQISDDLEFSNHILKKDFLRIYADYKVSTVA